MSTTRRTAHLLGTGLLGAALVGCGSSSTGPNNNNGGPDAAGPGTPDAAPPHVDAFQPSGNFYTIPLATPDGFLYTAQLAVGNQMFATDVDTGSTTVGIAASACKTCPVTPLYSLDSTGADDKQTANTSYEDGSGWSGEIYTDNVGFANGSPAVGVSFVGMTKQKGFFDGTTGDAEYNSYQGIVGLGPDALLEDGTTSYLTAAEKAGLKGEMAFELCLDQGTMWLGGYDASKAQSDVQFTPLLTDNADDAAFYTIELDDLAVGGKSLGYTATDFQNPVMDTGTSLQYLPTPVWTKLVSTIEASSGFQALFKGQTLSDPDNGPNYGCLPTSTATDEQVDAMLPALTFTMPTMSGGKMTVSVKPTQSYLVDGGGGQFCFTFGDGGTQGGSLFGDAFMQPLISVFDPADGQMGFADDAGCAAAGFRAERKVVIASQPGPHEHGHGPRGLAELRRQHAAH